MSNDALPKHWEPKQPILTMNGYSLRTLHAYAEDYAYKALAASKPEPQAQATNEHAEQSERAELIEWLNQSADQAAIFPSTKHEAKRYRQAASLLAAYTRTPEQEVHYLNGKIDGKIEAHYTEQMLAADNAGGAAFKCPSCQHEQNCGDIRCDNCALEYTIYTLPQPQPVPDDVVKDAIPDAQTYCARQSPAWAVSREWMNGWNACRAAMLKEGK